MRIAIIGSGVSGLVAARHLSRTHNLTVFEADTRLGGHVHTWDFEVGGRRWAVDSGFIVYNERNYPRFSRLLGELGVTTQPSTMSFSVRSAATGFEYNPSSLKELSAHPENWLRPSFWRLMQDILRFHRRANGGQPDEPLSSFLTRQGFSAVFRECYLLPMAAAIWSQPRSRILDMPTAFLFRFFENHGMLQVNDRPQWRVVEGGSRRYTEALVAPIRHCFRLGNPVREVRRFDDHVEVDGEPFDQVVFACHSDQALGLLADPTPAERQILGAIPYQANDVVIHTDTSLLPRRRRAWAAWNVQLGEDLAEPATLTYNMNLLQSLEAPETFLVTLNPTTEINRERILGRVCYHHPVFTVEAVRAQSRRREISGLHHTHYCGAYWGYGFHEDGVVSAEAVATEIGLAALKAAS